MSSPARLHPRAAPVAGRDTAYPPAAGASARGRPVPGCTASPPTCVRASTSPGPPAPPRPAPPFPPATGPAPPPGT
eukprot:4079315-Pleurochrysis_carterae.AAC.1